MQVKTTNPTATQGPSGGTGPSAGPLAPGAAAGLALVQRNLQKSANPKSSDQKPVMKPPKLKKTVGPAFGKGAQHPNQTGGVPSGHALPAGHAPMDGNLLDTALMPHLANLSKLAGAPSAAFHTGLMEAHGQGVEPGRSAASILSAALRGE